MSCTSHVVLKVVVEIVSSECDAYPIRCLRPLALLNITNITPMTVSVSQKLNILCIMFTIREFFTTTLFRPCISQGLVTIFPHSTLKPQVRNLKCLIFIQHFFKMVLHWCPDLIRHYIGTQLKLNKYIFDISIPFCHHLYLSATLKQCFT